MSDSYNKWGWTILIAAVSFNVLWILYFMIVQVPVDLGEESDIPPVIIGAGADISQVQDYWVSGELMIQKGAEVYSVYCALCHGAAGRGDGAAGRGLKPPPRDFREGDWKYGGSSVDLFKIITKGSEGTSMASFSHVPKMERWALVHFIRSLTKNPVPDDPDQTKEFASHAQ